MDTYTYRPVRVRNIWGAGLGWELTLYRNDTVINSWFFDDLAFAKTRLKRKINFVQTVYGAKLR